jgi:hypothetical protein
MTGIVKAARSWRQPTYQTRAIDISQDHGGQGVQGEISPVAIAAEPEVAMVIENAA